MMNIYKFFRSVLIALVLVSITLILIGYIDLKNYVKKNSLSQIVISSTIAPKTFNPVLVSETAPILTYLYDGLIQENERGQIKPCLAKSWQISEDKKIIIFTLREDLKWSDGQPITADDVVFTYQDIYFNPNIPNIGLDSLRIGESGQLPKVRKLDNLRIEFELPEPFFPFVRTTKLPILPAHVLRKIIENNSENNQFMLTWGLDTPPQEIIVNGAYQIEEYLKGERLILQKNPYYWRKDAQGNSLPYQDRIFCKIVENTQVSLIQFRSKSLDYLDLNNNYFSLLKKEETRGNFRLINGGQSSSVTFLSFNLNKGLRQDKPLVDPIKSRWFNTVEFRQAIAYAINREQMLNNVFQGLGELQNSLFWVHSPYYLSPEKGLKTYEYNPNKAKRILIKAGFKYNNQGQLLDAQDNLVKFTLTLNASNKIREPMAVQIKENLEKIGIKVDLQALDNALLFDKILNYWDWECILFSLNATVDPHDLAGIWIPNKNFHFFNQNSRKKDQRLTGYEVAEWEQEIGNLYIQASTEFDESKRQAIYAKAQQISQKYLPMIYLINPFSFAAVRNSVQGVKYSAIIDPFWNIYEWKIEQDL